MTSSVINARNKKCFFSGWGYLMIIHKVDRNRLRAISKLILTDFYIYIYIYILRVQTKIAVNKWIHIQMIALLRTPRIQRRVLEIWEDLLSLKLQWKPSANTDGKRSRGVNDNNNNNNNNKPGIRLRKWNAQNSPGFGDTNGSINLGPKTRPSDSH